jgi:mevalonate kinase
LTKQKTKKGPLEFYGRGKLLLTGEYFVLDGARSLAVPTQLGQKITIKEHRGSEIIWESFSAQKGSWFKAKYSILDLKPSESTDNQKAQYISNILRKAINHNSEFLSTWKGKKIIANLEFEPEWGLLIWKMDQDMTLPVLKLMAQLCIN